MYLPVLGTYDMTVYSSFTSLTFAMGTRDKVDPELPQTAAVPEVPEVDEEGAAELDGGVGVDDGDDDIGAGLDALAWCSACREFSILVITALWSVWMQLNLGRREYKDNW